MNTNFDDMYAVMQRADLIKQSVSFTEDNENERYDELPQENFTKKRDTLKINFNFVEAALRCLTKRVENLEEEF